MYKPESQQRYQKGAKAPGERIDQRKITVFVSVSKAPEIKGVKEARSKNANPASR